MNQNILLNHIKEFNNTCLTRINKIKDLKKSNKLQYMAQDIQLNIENEFNYLIDEQNTWDLLYKLFTNKQSTKKLKKIPKESFRVSFKHIIDNLYIKDKEANRDLVIILYLFF